MTGPRFDRDEVRTALLADLPHVAEQLLGPHNEALSKSDEWRWNRKGSFRMFMSGDDAGMWSDFEADEGGDIFNLIERIHRTREFPKALEIGALLAGVGSRNGRSHNGVNSIAALVSRKEPTHVAATPIEARISPTKFPPATPPDQTGRPKFYGAEPKKFGSEIRRHIHRQGGEPVLIKIKQNGHPAWLPYWRVTNRQGAVGWQNKRPAGYRAVPYVGAVDPFDPEVANDRLYWCEGEKDVDACCGKNIPAFTFGGVGDGLPVGAEQYLVGRHVVILSDNDPQSKDSKTGAPRFHDDGRPVRPGQDHAERKAALCYPVAASVRVIHFDELPPKEDVSDWFAQGHTAEELEARADATAAWHPPQPLAMPAPTEQAASGKRIAVLVRGDQIRLKSVQWAWRHRFAFGKLALIAGDPGLGKSQIALDIGARHTTGGVWPVDGTLAPRSEILVLTAEDGLSDTVAPRLVVAGADMSKVHFLRGTKAAGGEEELFDLTRDVEVLRSVLHEHPCIKVIVIDPLTAYLGETQAQRNSHVRKALAPLVRLIEDTGVLVIGVTHLNKSQGKAIYRVLDSIAFVALGRILHLVVQDAENPDNRKFICDKTNIGPKPPGLTFICEQVPVVTEDGDEWVSRIAWGTQHINETADQALGTDAASADGATAKEDCVEFLRRLLACGPLPAKEVERQAVAACLLPEGKSIGNSKPFREARKALDIKSQQARGERSGGWVWTLPEGQTPSEASDALPEQRASDGLEGA